MKKKIISLCMFVCAMSMFVACSDDDKPTLSSDATIATFAFDSADGIVTEQPVINTDGTITFKVAANATQAQLSTLTPTITLTSDKASVTPASGVAQDFSNGKQVVYTVTAEDGTKKAYTVSATQEVVNYPIDEQLAGSYRGSMDVLVNGSALASGLIQKVIVSKASDSSIKLEIKDFSLGGLLSLGDITVDNCPLSQEGNTYTFTGSQDVVLPDPIGKCPISLAGSFDADGNLTLDIDVTAPAQNQVIKVNYTGTKLTGNESSDATIATFMIADPDGIITEQPSINDDGTITFKVSESATEVQLSALVPTITLASATAVVSPASGVAQDFSNSKAVTYTVVAEDGTVKTYTASISSTQKLLKYTFDEEWGTQTIMYVKTYPAPQPTSELATSNGGAVMMQDVVPGYPCVAEPEGYKGAAIKLTTLDTRAYTFAGAVIAPITPGTVFTGTFNATIASLSNPLSTTHFGIPYSAMPVTFKGYYKYTPGTNYIDGSNTSDIKDNQAATDEPSIMAILYEYTGSEYLDGSNIQTSDKIAAIAQVTNVGTVNSWTAFNQPFTFLPGKSYDTTKTYKIAIVCASSKDGATFKGAVGSTLWIDELEVVGE
jgi:hypothetical protein